MFTVNIGTLGLREKINRLSGKRLVFAAVNATNDTAKDLQVELQHAARQEFTIRNEFAIKQAAVINPFASIRQAQVFAEIGVAIGKRKPERLFLAQYEKGGPRAEVAGRDRYAAPVIGGPARPSFKQKVPTALRYKALGLKGIGRKQGKKKTFVVPDIGVFQRTGTKPRDIQAVYLFGQSQRLKKRMRFYDVVARYAPRLYRNNFIRQLDAAITYALSK